MPMACVTPGRQDGAVRGTCYELWNAGAARLCARLRPVRGGAVPLRVTCLSYAIRRRAATGGGVSIARYDLAQASACPQHVL